MTFMTNEALLAGAILLAAAGSAHAQATDPARLSLVAGYKAAFTCSAHFNAGRTVEQIAGDELHRIYPGYRDALAALPDAEIYETTLHSTSGEGDDYTYDGESFKIVSVSYDGGTYPRMSVWRPHLGCSQLPTDAHEWEVQHIPNIDSSSLQTASGERWLNGEPSKGVVISDAPVGASLKKAASKGFDRKTYGDGTETTAILIVKDGDIAFEHYRDGFDAETPQRTWSVAKSIAATVIGAAVQDGVIDIDTPAGLKAWSSPGDPRGEITFADLMHMSSGLDAGPAGNRTDDIYFGGGRVVDHAITRRLIAKPGTRWYYANNDTMSLMRALREKMADDKAYLEYPFRRVLYPLRMDHTFLETDWNGDFIMSSQVWTTARDLARLGLLYLNDGVASDGVRILPKGWAEFVATPAADQPPPRANGDPRPGYGAQFWLFDESWGLPDETYAAMGNRGQYVVIVPARDVVIVRRGFDDNGGVRFDIAKFASDILAALPE